MIKVWGLAPLWAMKALTCITCTARWHSTKHNSNRMATVFDWGTDIDTISKKSILYRVNGSNFDCMCCTV